MAELDLNKVVHDIRNPLNTLMMTAELGCILADEKTANPEQMRELFKKIIDESAKITLQIEKLSASN